MDWAINLLKKKNVKITLFAILFTFCTWSVISANYNADIEDATERFSVLGEIQNIDSRTFKIENKGENDLKDKIEINYDHVQFVQTKDYQDLNFGNLRVGHSVIVQGVTDGRNYFAKRIILFDDIDLDDLENTNVENNFVDDGEGSSGGSGGGSGEETSTTTPEVEEETSTTTTETIDESAEETTPTTTPEIIEEDPATTTPEVEDATEETSTTTPEVEEETSTTTTETIDEPAEETTPTTTPEIIEEDPATTTPEVEDTPEETSTTAENQT